MTSNLIKETKHSLYDLWLSCKRKVSLIFANFVSIQPMIIIWSVDIFFSLFILSKTFIVHLQHRTAMHKTACTNLLPDIMKGQNYSYKKKLTFKEMHCQLTAFSFYGLLNKKERKRKCLTNRWTVTTTLSLLWLK